MLESKLRDRALLNGRRASGAAGTGSNPNLLPNAEKPGFWNLAIGSTAGSTYVFNQIRIQPLDQDSRTVGLNFCG